MFNLELEPRVRFFLRWVLESTVVSSMYAVPLCTTLLSNSMPTVIVIFKYSRFVCRLFFLLVHVKWRTFLS